MPKAKVSDDDLQEALNLVEIHGSGHKARLALGNHLPPRVTIDNRAQVARLRGMRPTVRKDAPRIYEKQRLGEMHMVILDTQVKPGVNTDHLEHIGNYAQEKQPDTIIMIGDWWDMPSLSTYDKGKTAFEGRRYVKDIESGRSAMERMLAPIKYSPRLVFCMGNHEMRIQRVVDLNAEYQDKFDLSDMGIADYGWEVVPFLKPIEIDGVLYCHYFTSGVMGRPVSSAAVLLREAQQSATMGHVQFGDMAMHKKTRQRAVFGGTSYTHMEEYLGHQGNNHPRQILMKHEVENGCYDLMEVSLRFLAKAYA